MADKKITALTDLGDSLASADLFHVVDDPRVTPVNKKMLLKMFLIIYLHLGLKQTSQTATADGSTTIAINVTTPITEIDATSPTSSCSFADGSDGQVKTIINTSSSTNLITIHLQI